MLSSSSGLGRPPAKMIGLVGIDDLADWTASIERQHQMLLYDEAVATAHKLHAPRLMQNDWR